MTARKKAGHEVAENTNFEALFNLNDIQHLQDDFSAATGVASIITQVDGTPITRPSNFCRLCSEIIRKTERGNENCCKSDSVLGTLQFDGPIVQPCLSGGLWDAGAGIAVGGKHIANWLIGQVRDETQTDAKMLDYAREIGVDGQAFLKAFKEVPAMSREKFDKIAKVLYTITNQLSVLAYQNVQQARFIHERMQADDALHRNAEMQTVLREIAETTVLAVTLDELYAKVHQSVERILPAKNFYISILDDTGSHLVTPYCMDETHTVPPRRPVGKGLADYVMSQRKAVYMSKQELARLLEKSEVFKRYENYIKWAGAPLIDSTGKAFGIVALFLVGEDKLPLQPEDLEVLSIIAAQISLAIERKRAEAGLVAERNLLKTLIDEIPDRIFIKDKESRYTLNNIAHVKALGAHSQSEVTGKSDHDFWPAQFAISHLADDQYVMENDKPLYDYEEQTSLPSGEPGTLLVTKVPMHNSTGEVIGLISISRDISESKRAEESERRSNKIQNILREIAETAVMAASLNEMYVKVHLMVNQVLPTKNFFIALLDEAAREIVVPYCVDEMNLTPQRRPIGKGMTEYAMRQGEAVYLNSAALDQLWKTGDIDMRFAQVNEWLGAPLRNSAGKIFGVIALFTLGDAPPYEPEDLEVLAIIAAQISLAIERKQMEDSLRESEALYFALVQNATASIILRDESGLITYANETFVRMMQANAPTELLGRSYLECVHPDDREGSRRRIATDIAGIPSPLREHRLVGLRGQTIFVESTGVPITKGGRPYAMGVFHDVTERKRLEELLQYQATTDGLTGIYNRCRFLERADEELQRIHRYGGICSLLMLDIDHFKLVNDDFGHAVGDSALRWVSELCKEATRSTDLLGRIGGEEFVGLLLQTGISEAKQVAERLRQSIQDRGFSTKEGIQIPLRVSIGVAEHKPDESLSELMIRADKVLYRAKSEGRNKVVAAE